MPVVKLPVTTPKFRRSGLMQVNEKAAREMFQAAGLPQGDWNRKRLVSKLENIVEVMSSTPNELEGEHKQFFLKLCDSLQNEESTITLDSQEEDEKFVSTKKENKSTKKENKVSKNQENGKEESKTKEAKNKNKEKTKISKTLDGFGFRTGTHKSAINAALSTKPKSMKTLIEEVGAKSSYPIHLSKLISMGWVNKNESKEYYLTPEGKEQRKKKVTESFVFQE